MAKPPGTGPHSDIDGVDQDARAGRPDRSPGNGSAKQVRDAEDNSKGRPKASGKMSTST